MNKGYQYSLDAYKNALSGRAREAYNMIADDIMSGGLQANDPLSELAYTARMKSSRTPVREALVALEQDGLVKRIPNRGWFVAETSERDMDEIFELRRLLEVYAFKISCKRIPVDELRWLREEIARLSESSDRADFFRTDRELHFLTVKYAGNRNLENILSTLNMRVEYDRTSYGKSMSVLMMLRNEHLDIIDALLREDYRGAEKLLSRHIRHVKDDLLSGQIHVG